MCNFCFRPDDSEFADGLNNHYRNTLVHSALHAWETNVYNLKFCITTNHLRLKDPVEWNISSLNIINCFCKRITLFNNSIDSTPSPLIHGDSSILYKYS